MRNVNVNPILGVPLTSILPLVLTLIPCIDKADTGAAVVIAVHFKAVLKRQVMAVL